MDSWQWELGTAITAGVGGGRIRGCNDEAEQALVPSVAQSEEAVAGQRWGG
jgi:hypothetical protein